MTGDTPSNDRPTASINTGTTAAGDTRPPTFGTGERPADSVGPYKLLDIIGEGGFGTVWLAERREPMVQRVALKIIKPGMDSKAVVARFEQERQALAVMDHPNVARVFDGGVTPSGRPYFVMEHVQGETITAFADRRRLTLRQRLELFIPVCEAVQHAHHKGLIHRDIKPSNVLVAEIEGKPVPKVIDFGVAKAIASSGWENTAHTQSGMVIGTPEYMSPEQVAGEIDVDTRSDVYSLGVLLYELLTGELPFDSGELRKAALAEIQRIIREVTPPKPSTRLVQLAGERTTTIAEARSASRDRLTSELRRELDWIPLMALRKERERRYASPQALADDVQRYLDGRPLLAAPDSRAYLAKKFVRRNKVQVFAAAAVFVALGSGLGVALWQRNEAIASQRAEAKQRAEADEQRARADERAEAATKAEAAATAARDSEKERADQLKKVSDFQSQMLAQIDTTKAGIDLMADVRERFVAALEKAGVPEAERTTRVDALRQELVRVNATDAAAAMIDRTILRPAIKTIDEQFKDDPATDASLRQALAALYHSIGLYDAAFPLQESALATRRRVLGEEHPDTLTSMSNMGTLLQAEGKLAEAEPYLREALEKRRRVLGEEHQNTLSSINIMGLLLHAQGNQAEAESFFRDALDKRRRILGKEHPDTLVSLNNMGGLFQDQGKLAEAEPYLREAVEKSRRVLSEEHPSTLTSISNLGALLRDQGKLAEAEQYWGELMKKRRLVLGEEHPDTITSINNMGALLWSQKKLGEAERYWEEALEKSRRVRGEEHPNTLRSITNMGFLLRAQGKLDQAEPYWREALEKSRRVLGAAHPDTLVSIGNMGVLLRDQGKLSEAEPYYREALEIRRRVLGEDHADTIGAIGTLAMLLDDAGKDAEAEAAWIEALEKCRLVMGEEHPLTLIAMVNAASLRLRQNKLEEATPLLRESLERSRRVNGDAHRTTVAAIANLGLVFQRTRRYQEASELLAPAVALARAIFIDEESSQFGLLLTTLARARIGLGYDPERFALAESNLLEAHQIYLAAKDRGPTHKDTLECVQALVDLYTARHAAEPGKGYDAKAAEWKAKLPEPEPAQPEPAQPNAAPASPADPK